VNKKKQKNFGRCGVEAGATIIKSFLLLFFKKEVLSFPFLPLVFVAK